MRLKPKQVVTRLGRSIRAYSEAAFERHGDPSAIPLRLKDEAGTTAVERYWGQHTVNPVPFKSALSSLRDLAARSGEYPLFETLMELQADHSHDVVLDFGCGPGNDVVGFLSRGGAKRVVGMDVSRRALELARSRLALHGFDASRVELVQVSDDNSQIPLASGSIDYLYCEGVLHHTSHPEAILAELARVLRVGGHGHLMVYNRNSLWFHLYTAYHRQVVEGAFAGLSADAAFQLNTDGEDCPIARAYQPEEFVGLCRQAGFQASFVGGYFGQIELELLRTSLAIAVADPQLAQEHTRFLENLTIDGDGYPRYQGHYAGVGGVYRVGKLE